MRLPTVGGGNCTNAGKEPAGRQYCPNVQPFERLRRLARDSGPGGDDADQWFVAEAADCLAGFADDPAGLVVACRRLLAHHPTAGVLWWLCSHVLTAPDPAEAAWDAARRLDEDRTARRLGDWLPFPHDEPIAVLGWPPITGVALADRTDLDVVVTRPRGGDGRLASRLRIAGANASLLDEHELAERRPSHLLLEANAASPTDAVVAAGAYDLARELGGVGTTVVLVTGLGRVLPERLMAALRRGVDPTDPDSSWELLPLDTVHRVATPVGLRDPGDLARQVDCPIAPELLRLA